MAESEGYSSSSDDEQLDSMNKKLKKAAIEGDVAFLREAVHLKPVEYFQSVSSEELARARGNIFHLAAYHGRVEFIRVAMKMLPEPLVLFLLRQQDGHENMEPLQVAYWRENYNIVHQIAEYNMEKQNSVEWQSMYAAIEGDVKILRHIAGSNPPDQYLGSLIFKTDDGNNAGNIFHVAAMNNRVEFLREAMTIIPKSQVDFLITWPDHQMRNLLHVAALKGYNGIIMLILEFYESLSITASSSSSSSSSSSVQYSFSNSKPWLLRDKDRYTPCHHIMPHCNEGCALKLLSMDMELFSKFGDDIQDSDNNPLIAALSRGFSQVISKFLASAPDWGQI